MPSHPLRHPDVIERLALEPRWPSYTGISQLVGTTSDGRCTVYVDPSLGAPGFANAHDLLMDANRVMAFNDKTFGVVGGHVDVIVFALGGMTDGTGGADHMGCDFATGQNIEVCASFGNSARVIALFEAELSECSMNNQLCGLSTGEALSRWCAMVVSNNALSDFALAPTWFADGMPNFVDTVDPTDRNYDSIGCGMAYLSWIQAKTGQSLATIAQKMVALGDTGTLAQIYHDPPNAWTDFQAAIAALPAGVTSDDPFGALSPQPQPGPTGPTGPAPQPSPGPTGATGATGPSPTPVPGVSSWEWIMLAIDAMFAGWAKGETAAQIKADVDGIPT